MPRSKAATVQEYLAELPGASRSVIETVRAAILAALPSGYVEAMRWGMINYEIPLEVYPQTYNDQPLGLVALAAQARHYAVYLTCVGMDPEIDARLGAGFAQAGQRLDMGKSCIRFRRLDQFPLHLIADVIRDFPAEKLIELYERSRASSSGAPSK